MTTGLGLVLLGVWAVPVAAMLSRTVSSTGVLLALIVAIGMTIWLA